MALDLSKRLKGNNISKSEECRIAALTGGRQTGASGHGRRLRTALPGAICAVGRADVEAGDFLLESKATLGHSISITLEMLSKIVYQATLRRKKPGIVLTFEILRLRQAVIPARWLVIPLE